MKKRSASILFLLVFSLLIQNTCPFGAAGKSTVACACEQCPLKHCVTADTPGRNHLTSDASSIHFPLYVFAMPQTNPAVEPVPTASLRPPLTGGYQDALPDELLRPPQA